MKNLTQTLFLCFASLSFWACNEKNNTSCPEGAVCSDEVQTTESGLKYIHHIHYPDRRTPNYLEMLTMNYLLLTDKGDTLTNTYTTDELVGQEYLKPAYKGAIEEGFGMMAIGDSATFFVTIDSLQNKQDLPILPHNPDSIEEIKYVIKLYNIQSKGAYEIDEAARLKKRTQKQVKVQDQKIQKYIAARKLDSAVQKHRSGLYYQIKEEGEGAIAKVGDSVSFNYKTYDLMTGRLLDQSKQTVGLVVGKQQIIPAWQVFFRQMAKKEMKADLLVPSHLGFGNKRHQNLPAFSLLRFDIEIVDIVRR